MPQSPGSLKLSITKWTNISYIPADMVQFDDI